MEAKDLKVQSSSLTLLVSANSKTEGEGEQSSFGRFGWFVTQPTFLPLTKWKQSATLLLIIPYQLSTW